MRRISLVPLVAGVAWIAFKADYLGMDADDGLKALIVAPGAILLVVAAILAYGSAKDRLGAASVALGGVAVLWQTREPLPNGGWTFYTPYSSLADAARLPSGSSPWLLAAAILLPSLGIAILRRGSSIGALLIGAALWCEVGFSPSRALDATLGMPNRRYYYSGGRSSACPNLDPVLPILLGLAGIAVSARRGGREDGVSPPSAARAGGL